MCHGQRRTDLAHAGDQHREVGHEVPRLLLEGNNDKRVRSINGPDQFHENPR